MIYDLVVVGGGASGLVAAIVAARRGAKVLIIEKNAKLGKKILATGNGRCNLGNDHWSLDNFVSTNVGVAEKVLRRFDNQAAKRFFGELGLLIISEEGRWYPRTKQAASVLTVLLSELARQGVATAVSSPVHSIEATSRGFTLRHGTGQSQGLRVLLTTGGMAAPKLGCTGDGYRLAEALGHSLLAPSPALVGLRLQSAHLKTLSGLRLAATVAIPELGLSEHGEVLFTDYGLSGIPVFDLSRAIGHRQGLTLRLKLAYEESTESKLLGFLRHYLGELSFKAPSEALAGYLPHQLCLPVLKEAGLEHKKFAGDLSRAELARLSRQLFWWDFPIVGLHTWEQAQTTWGGIPLDEVDPATLCSKVQGGLYFAGEVLDVHGRCGGYNLHWAFASGFVAGQASAHCPQS
ncbi:MAG: aminoacetone oxidase family FAD-binding enzyme [Firmicutes bacterium]|nr:aminoacetone oxidase family FAD-binding enzyme [Dethiobacter sp.]MBS3889046.1 aminoacetone oxidase family FAD-binding enzyme [Bacillota bacterium]MBS4053762.1 aminoacetone oxidase family FAD-binding enzyme [Thermaerobacter sp.]